KYGERRKSNEQPTAWNGTSFACLLPYLLMNDLDQNGGGGMAVRALRTPKEKNERDGDARYGERIVEDIDFRDIRLKQEVEEIEEEPGADDALATYLREIRPRS